MPSKSIRRYRGRGTKYVTGGRRRRTMAGRRRIHRGRGLGSAYRIAYPRDEMGRPLRGQVLNYF